MLFRRVSPKNTLGAAIRSLQDGRTRGVVRSSTTVHVNRTTRGVIIQGKRRISDESTGGSSTPRYA